jgi:hypothetical protein
LAACDAPAYRDVLRRLQEQPHPRNLRQFRAQPVDDLRSRNVAVIAQLQSNNEPAGILGIAVAWSEERAEIGDVRVLRDHIGKLALDLPHLVRRNVLSRLGNAEDHADVLNRKEAFRHHDEQHAGNGNRRQENHQGGELMAQHQIKAATIAVENEIEPTLNDPIKPAMLSVVFADQKPRAQHRRQSQRNHDRNDD